MNADSITADLADDGDIAQILRLNKAEYGATDILTTPADFAWRADRNPAGRAIIPVIRDKNGEVVGFIWVVPLYLRIDGQDWLAATGTNLVIQPDYRQGFGYLKLMRRFERVFHQNSLPLHFSFVSEENYQRRREQAPSTVTTLPLLVKPLNLEMLAQPHLPQGWQRFGLRWVDKIATRLIFQQPPTSDDSQITVCVCENIDGTFDQFWQRVQNKYKVMLIRNRAFLAWRFADVSGRRYHTLVAEQNGQMIGYAILRCAVIRDIETGLIMDLLVTPGQSGQRAGLGLVRAAEAYFKQQAMAVIVGGVPTFAAEYDLLRQAGYVPLPQTLAPRRFRFAFFTHSQQPAFAKLSTQQWLMTLADYESF